MSSQNRIVLGVLGAVVVIAGFWFMVLAPKRDDISAADAQIVSAQGRRDAAIAAAAGAEKAKAGYKNDVAAIARLGKAVPGDDDIASLVYQLETVAKANKIDFRSLKLSPGTAAAAPADTNAASTDKSKKEGDTSATTPVAPVVAQPPPGTVVGTAGLLTVPFTFQFDGDYLKLQRFLKAINGLANGKGERITVRGRLLTVDGFALSPGKDGFPQLKAVVSATAYLAPLTDNAAAATTPPATGATAGATSTSALTTPTAQGAGR